MDFEALSLTCEAQVLRTQRKLHQWRQQGEAIRDVWGFVVSDHFLAAAWNRLRQNAGSKTAGVDGLTRRDVERAGIDAFLKDVQRDLKSGAYQPQPVRQVAIPKVDGRVRYLGIPALQDRLVQMVLKLVLEPVFEAEFHDCNWGFRPGRGCHDAIADIRNLGNPPVLYGQVVEADIEACFDRIDHRLLMQALERRVRDRKVLRLVGRFLAAGVWRNGRVERDEKGVPQGGVLSPLLANAYLHELDDWYHERYHCLTHWGRLKRRRDGGATARLVRYADDFVVLMKGTSAHAEQERRDLESFLEQRLHLKASPLKTHVTHLDQGIDFLGLTVRNGERRRGGRVVMVYPSRKSVRRVLEKVREWTNRSRVHLPLAAVLVNLNRLLRGWAAYFRYSAASRTFAYVGWYVWHAIWRWLRRKHPHQPWRWIAQRYGNGHPWTDQGVELFRIERVHVARWPRMPRRRPLPWDAAPEPAG